MVNVKEFLLNNTNGGTYAIVEYKGITEPIWFSRHYHEPTGEWWYLESPCNLYSYKIDEPVSEFYRIYVTEMLETDDENEMNDYIERHLKPMIIDGRFHEIDCPQTYQFMPEEADSIVLVSEKECLEWMLENWKQD